LLEEFVSSELESTLQKIAGEGWANTGQQSASTFICNDLSEAADQAAVVCDGVELDSRLDAEKSQRMLRVERTDLHIDGCEATVGD